MKKFNAILMAMLFGVCGQALATDYYLYAYDYNASGNASFSGTQFTETSTAGVYKIEGVTTPSANWGLYVLVDNGWTTYYGKKSTDVSSPGSAVAMKQHEDGEGVTMCYLTPGVYDITWDATNMTIQFDLHKYYTSTAANLEFLVQNGNAIVRSLYNSGDVTIPATVKYRDSSDNTKDDAGSPEFPVTTIGAGSGVAEGTGITSVTLPSSATTISDWAFYNSTAITSVYSNASTAPTIGDHTFAYWDGSSSVVNRSSIDLYVPQDSKSSYATNWTSFKSTNEFTNISVGSTGYTTYYNSQRAFSLPQWVEANTVTAIDNKILTLTKSYENTTGTEVLVPKGCAMLLKWWEGNYKVVLKDEGETFSGENMLYGTDAAETPANDADYYYYKLANGASGLGWYWGTAETGASFQNGAHKAYLKVLKTSAAARSFINMFDDETTAISKVETANVSDDAIYTLSGVRVNPAALQPGTLYIKNGKKFINK